MKVELRWKDGRRFAPRVWVCVGQHKYLFHVPAARALQWLEAGWAMAFREGRRVGRIAWLRTAGRNPAPALPWTLGHYAGRRAIYRERFSAQCYCGHWTYTFRHIPTADRWVFQLALQENLLPTK